MDGVQRCGEANLIIGGSAAVPFANDDRVSGLFYLPLDEFQINQVLSGYTIKEVRREEDAEDDKKWSVVTLIGIKDGSDEKIVFELWFYKNDEGDRIRAWEYNGIRFHILRILKTRNGKPFTAKVLVPVEHGRSSAGEAQRYRALEEAVIIKGYELFRQTIQVFSRNSKIMCIVLTSGLTNRSVLDMIKNKLGTENTVLVIIAGARRDQMEFPRPILQEMLERWMKANKPIVAYIQEEGKTDVKQIKILLKFITNSVIAYDHTLSTANELTALTRFMNAVFVAGVMMDRANIYERPRIPVRVLDRVLEVDDLWPSAVLILNYTPISKYQNQIVLNLDTRRVIEIALKPLSASQLERLARELFREKLKESFVAEYEFRTTIKMAIKLKTFLSKLNRADADIKQKIEVLRNYVKEVRSLTRDQKIKEITDEMLEILRKVNKTGVLEKTSLLEKINEIVKILNDKRKQRINKQRSNIIIK